MAVDQGLPGEAAEELAVGPGSGARILVVDDSRVNRLMLTRLLTSLGHEPVEVEPGRAAIERLRDAGAAPIDLVLLDCQMPVLDGYETLALMKSDPNLAAIPVIVISDVDDIASVVRCIEMGAADYLPRPYEPSILQARIGTSVENARLVRTISRQPPARFLSAGRRARRARRRGIHRPSRRIPAVFCDLRGFTAFTETAEPEELLVTAPRIPRRDGDPS
jgi:CheY-like chemotaxis protein